MCGRFTLRQPPRQLAIHFGIDEPPALRPRYNIAPTQDVAIVRLAPDGHRELVELRWGLVPSWSQDPTIGSRMINARGETLAEKPSFRAAFKERRCLIPADGFYEWLKVDKQKQPQFIHLPDDEPFAFAGLWEAWRGSDPPLETCTIVTTEANSRLRGLHERMPVILDPADYAAWLDPQLRDPQRLMPLLAARPNALLETRPVSRRVNAPTYDDEGCLAPAEEA
ncbi:MAG: SOS response-associated peptidase [Pirellulales bacterium]|nr:SOS response-associated peptidase [Pirellulales bacterium]